MNIVVIVFGEILFFNFNLELLINCILVFGILVF